MFPVTADLILYLAASMSSTLFLALPCGVTAYDNDLCFIGDSLSNLSLISIDGCFYFIEIKEYFSFKSLISLM